MRIGCCSFVFGGLDLENSLRLCRMLGFRCVDASAADVGPNTHLDRQAAAAAVRSRGGTNPPEFPVAALGPGSYGQPGAARAQGHGADWPEGKPNRQLVADYWFWNYR